MKDLALAVTMIFGFLGTVWFAYWVAKDSSEKPRYDPEKVCADSGGVYKQMYRAPGICFAKGVVLGKK